MNDTNLKTQQGRYRRRQLANRGKKSKGKEVVGVLMAMCVLLTVEGKVVG